jgi:hypothetical protein
MTDTSAASEAFEHLSSVRIQALMLSRKMWQVRDGLERYLDKTDSHNDPMYRDIKTLFEDADYIEKLLANMDERCLYIKHNYERSVLLAGRTDISDSVD